MLTGLRKMKKSAFLIAVMFGIVSSFAAGAQNCSEEQCTMAGVEDSVVVAARNLADQLVKNGMKMLGTPYHYGVSGPKTFDCSGFTRFLYKEFGYVLDHSSSGQSRQGREVKAPRSNLQKGDLVIFAARHNTDRIGHVGIFIEADSSGKNFTFIHAAVQGGVIVSHYSEPYYSSRYIGARRILPDFAPAE